MQIQDALQLFRGRLSKPFVFMHCWQILRNTRKWEDELANKDTERTAGTDAGTDLDAHEASEDASAEELPRPIGRDRAKKRRSNVTPSSESSACLELFQQMAKSRELKNQQEALWASEQKQHNERELALKEEKLRMKKEDARFAREKWEREKLNEDNEIMKMDLSSCSDVAREYFLSLQREILDRRLRRRDPDGQQ